MEEVITYGVYLITHCIKHCAVSGLYIASLTADFIVYTAAGFSNIIRSAMIHQQFYGVERNLQIFFLLRPVYTGDFCRATQCNFCRAEAATSISHV